eukprot:10782673-Heterocapsa_arctica.AAC.1
MYSTRRPRLAFHLQVVAQVYLFSGPRGAFPSLAAFTFASAAAALPRPRLQPSIPRHVIGEVASLADVGDDMAALAFTFHSAHVASCALSFDSRPS